MKVKLGLLSEVQASSFFLTEAFPSGLKSSIAGWKTRVFLCKCLKKCGFSIAMLVFGRVNVGCC